MRWFRLGFYILTVIVSAVRLSTRNLPADDVLIYLIFMVGCSLLAVITVVIMIKERAR